MRCTVFLHTRRLRRCARPQPRGWRFCSARRHAGLVHAPAAPRRCGRAAVAHTPSPGCASQAPREHRVMLAGVALRRREARGELRFLARQVVAVLRCGVALACGRVNLSSGGGGGVSRGEALWAKVGDAPEASDCAVPAAPVRLPRPPQPCLLDSAPAAPRSLPSPPCTCCRMVSAATWPLRSPMPFASVKDDVSISFAPPTSDASTYR
jgi:hypothetical protein